MPEGGRAAEITRQRSHDAVFEFFICIGVVS